MVKRRGGQTKLFDHKLSLTTSQLRRAEGGEKRGEDVRRGERTGKKVFGMAELSFGHNLRAKRKEVVTSALNLLPWAQVANTRLHSLI